MPNKTSEIALPGWQVGGWQNRSWTRPCGRCWNCCCRLKPPRPCGGRPRLPHRQVLRGILFVLRSGLPWELLPRRAGLRLGHDLLAQAERSGRPKASGSAGCSCTAPATIRTLQNPARLAPSTTVILRGPNNTSGAARQRWQVREEVGQIFSDFVRDFAHHSGAQMVTSPESMIFRSRVRTGRLNALAVATITRSAGSR